MNLLEMHPKASPQHRLGGYVLDVALILSTCVIGWIIWSLVIWGQGLTPGKQILKMKVVSSYSGLPATWGHMAIRQFLIPMAMSLPFSVLAAVFTPDFYSDDWSDFGTTEMMGLSLLFNIALLIVVAVDAFWILNKGENRRVTDLWAKTDVVNTSNLLPNVSNRIN